MKDQYVFINELQIHLCEMKNALDKEDVGQALYMLGVIDCNISHFIDRYEDDNDVYDREHEDHSHCGHCHR